MELAPLTIRLGRRFGQSWRPASLSSQFRRAMSAHTSITLWDIVKRLLQSFLSGERPRTKVESFLSHYFLPWYKLCLPFLQKTPVRPSDVRCLQVSLTEPFSLHDQTTCQLVSKNHTTALENSVGKNLRQRNERVNFFVSLSSFSLISSFESPPYHQISRNSPSTSEKIRVMWMAWPENSAPSKKCQFPSS